MKIPYYLMIILILPLTANTQGMDSIFFTKHKEVGLNLTNLIAQFIPFGNNAPSAGPFIVSFKSYGKKKTALRIGLGLNTFNSFSTTDRVSFNVRIGYEKRRIINSKLTYINGFDFVILAGDIGNPVNNPDEEFGAVGLGIPLGIEYNIYPNLFLSIETLIFFGIGSDIIDLSTIPPTGLFLNTRF